METLFTPQELLHVLNKIEAELGRERLIHWGPRTVDLDIIFYDDEINRRCGSDHPHVDMQNRLFGTGTIELSLCPGKVHPVVAQNGGTTASGTAGKGRTQISTDIKKKK